MTWYSPVAACSSTLWAHCWLLCASWHRYSACGMAKITLGASKGLTGPSVRSMSLTAISNKVPLLLGVHPVPSQGDLSGSLACGTHQESTAKKIIFAAKKENYLVSQKKLKGWEERQKIIEIKACSDVSQSCSEKASRALISIQAQPSCPSLKIWVVKKLHLRKKHLSKNVFCI